MGDNCLKRCCHAIHHHVDEDSGSCGGRTSHHPCTAYLARGVIKRDVAIATFSDLSAKNALVKLGRAGDVSGRNLQVTDLAICEGWGH
jgi:hypothetical protein